MMSSTTEVNKAAGGQQNVGVKADVKVSSKDDGGAAASGSLTFGGDEEKKSRKKNAHRTWGPGTCTDYVQRDALEEAQCFDISISSLKEMDVLSLPLQLVAW